MFLVNTRKRNKDDTFGHTRMPKGRYRVYEFKKVSEGEEAQERKLQDIPTDKDTLILIHGFNNDFDDVTGAYLDFQKRIRREGFSGNVMGFTWPSYGKWYQYFGDKDQVEYAVPAFLNFITKFRPRLPQKKLHVNTHSMGSHLLFLTLADYSRIQAIPEALPGAYLVDETTFFAADVSNNVLESGQDGRDAVREAERLSSYFNPNDPVLGISQIVNGDGRLGMGAERPRRLPNKAFQLNCSTLIEGHTRYRRNTAIMRDVVAVLAGTPSDDIEDRTPTGEKNTFRLGPEPEEDDSDLLDDD